MTGKGLWAELEFMEGAECQKLLKGELFHILWMDVNPNSAQALPVSGLSTGSFSLPLSSVLPRFTPSNFYFGLVYSLPLPGPWLYYAAARVISTYLLILLKSGKPHATARSASLGHAKEPQGCERPGTCKRPFLP